MKQSRKLVAWALRRQRGWEAEAGLIPSRWAEAADVDRRHSLLCGGLF